MTSIVLAACWFTVVLSLWAGYVIIEIAQEKRNEG